jgi:methionyl-tRNA formyltransferase
MEITFGKIERIIILGGSWLTAALLRQLAGRKVEVLLYTSFRHHNEVVDDDGNTLKQIADIAGISSVISKDINNDQSIKNAITDKTLGLAIGAAWLFEPKTAALFNGRLLDFMGIALPQYRGGAHYTWQILAGNKTGACNLQIIYGGKHAFHKGEIIKRRDYFFPASARKPKDYFSAAIKEELDFLNKFFDEIFEGKQFSTKTLQESFSSYYPFLNTLKHGWIDWSWNVSELDRFICAFDDPYAGASTYLSGNRVFLKGCQVEPSEPDFHPFHAGLIYRCSPIGVFIASRGGALLVRQILNKEGTDITNKMVEGQRLTTPRAELEAAMVFDAIYGAEGLEE